MRRNTIDSMIVFCIAPFVRVNQNMAATAPTTISRMRNEPAEDDSSSMSKAMMPPSTYTRISMEGILRRL